MGRLVDKLTFITGAAGGQGRAAALRFAAEGAVVVGCDLDAEGSQRTADDVRAAGGRMASFGPVDLNDADAAAAWIDAGVAAVGGIDVLYNNAAIARAGSIPDLSLEDWRFTMQHEVDLLFHTTRAAWPHLVARGGGSIINTASVVALRPSPGWLVHATAKGAVIAFSQALAADGAQHAIRSNAISPGMIDTPQLRSVLGSMADRPPIPLGRLGQAEDVAECAVYLAADESRWVTAANFILDGGVAGTRAMPS